MSTVSSRSFNSPDETRSPDRTKVEVVRLGAVTIARLTFQPGWTWSECVKPVVGTTSCQARHVGAVISGRLHVVHDDGTEADVGPGEAYVIEPGHDASVVGDEEVVAFEFESADTYARPLGTN
jgi:mannose-6-phosphate isomerase-like protein (cupin superfamily)